MNVKVALILAAGMVLSAAVVSFAPIWSWQAGTDARLDRIEDAGYAQDRRLDRIDASIQEQTAKAEKALAAVNAALREGAAEAGQSKKHLGELDSSVGLIRKQLAALNLERAVAPPPRPVVPPNSIALLTLRLDRASELLPASEDPFFIIRSLNSELAALPGLVVTPLSAIPGHRKDEKEGSAEPRVAGETLGVRYILTPTVMWTTSSSFGSDRISLYLELSDSTTGSVVWAGGTEFRSSGWRETNSEAVKKLKELAQKVGEKVAKKP